eukprot:2029437-Lingulodinium_polyedra.AAC.1
MAAREEITGRGLDLATTSYADDLAQKPVFKSIDGLQDEVREWGRLLDVALRAIDVRRNKAEEQT